MSDPFLGEIRLVGFTFAPAGWAFCNGQTLPISQNQALFALIGTVYGGNGTTTFNLPNLQGCVPIHAGQLAGGANYVLGQNGGVENVTLTTNQMPLHSHQVNGSSSVGTASSPAGNVWAQTVGTRQATAATIYAASAGSPMSSAALSANGGNAPHENRPPFLVLNFIIALQGIFPSRP